MYCPKCKKIVPEERHVFSDRIEYWCPHCGHRIEVVHEPFKRFKTQRWYSTRTV